MENILSGVQQPTFEEFRRERTFQEFAPTNYGGGFTISYDIEKSVGNILSTDVKNTRSVKLNERDSEGKEREKQYVATIFDIPKFANTDSDKDIVYWVNNFFSADITEASGIEKMNYLLDWGLYTYNWVYHGNLPKKLRELRFSSLHDICIFIRHANGNHKLAGVFQQVLKCMLGSGVITNNPKLSKVQSYLKDFKRKHIDPNFEFLLNKKGFGEGVLYIPLGGEKVKNVKFKIRYRGKGHSSIHKKLLSNPKISEEEVFNDLLGFEFEVDTKDDMIFLLNYLFETVVLKNFQIGTKDGKSESIDTLVKALKQSWGFDIRQKNMISPEEVIDFIHRYPGTLHKVMEAMFVGGEVRNEARAMTGKNFSDIKFQGLFQFGGGLESSSVELRIVLKGNKNNDGLEHQVIRDGEKILRVKSRIAHGFTPNYLQRVASIVLQGLGESEYSNETTPHNILSLSTHYGNKVEELITGSGVYAIKGDRKRLDVHGITIRNIK